MTLTAEQINTLNQEHRSSLSAQNAIVKLTGAGLSGSVAAASGTIGFTTNEPASLTAVTLKNSNAVRKSLKINNASAGVLYIQEGASVSTSLYTWRLVPNAVVIIDDYTGVVTGLWDVSTGSAVITETT